MQDKRIQRLFERNTQFNSYENALHLKRKLLGLCGKLTVKSPDEVVALLIESRVVSSVREGRQLVPELVGKDIAYAPNYKFIRFENAIDAVGSPSYRIIAWSLTT